MDGILNPIKATIRSVMKVLARALDKLSGGKITPNQITAVGLIAHIPIAWLIADQRNIWAAILLVAFGLFDTLDGELARLKGSANPSGMFLDSFTDRMKEILLYVGITYSIIFNGRPYMAVWAVAALGVSMLITYINAWGEVSIARHGVQSSVNKKFRGGLMGFEVRMFIILLGLLSGRLVLAVVAITILGLTTVAQRYQSVMDRLNSD